MLVNTRQRRLALVVVAALSATLSACSSNGGTSGSAPAEAPVSGGPGGDSAAVATARQNVAPFLKVPTTINQQVPLSGPVPKDNTWVVITCELPQCQLISDGALAAAKAAGVPTKLLSYQTTDGTTLTAAMKQALQLKPFAVSPIGFAQALWTDLQKDYQQAGVFITPMAVGDLKTSDVVTEGSATQFDYSRSGGLMADWVIADSNAGAKVLVLDVPAFAVLKAYGDGFKAEMKAKCTGCDVQALDVAPAQLASNGLVPAVISSLQTNPDVKYLVATDAAFLVGIEAALKSAGLDGLKIVGGSPDINNLKAVQSGSQTAMTAAAEDQYGWVALDIVFRHALKMDVPKGNGGRVEMIATRDTVVPSATGLSAPKDYQAQYLKLWGVS